MDIGSDKKFFLKLTLCIACAHSLASQCMEGHWMWDYQMCEAEILQGSGKGHTLINLFLKIQISDLEFSLYVHCGLSMMSQWKTPWKHSLERPLGGLY